MEMGSVEVTVERWLVGPHLLDVNEPGLKHIFGVNIVHAARFASADFSHPLHDRAGRRHILGRQSNRSDNQQHDRSIGSVKDQRNPHFYRKQPAETFVG